MATVLALAGLGDKKDFFDALIHFPMAVKSFGQYKAVACSKTVNAAVRVNHAAAALQNVAELHISRAIGAKGTCRCFPDATAELSVLGAEAFQRQIGGVAVDRTTGFARPGVGQVLSFDANQMGHVLKKRSS